MFGILAAHPQAPLTRKERKATAMPTVPAPQLRHITHALIVALGSADEIAQIVADSLVEANIVGHDSHGVLRLPWYADHARSGQVRAGERPALLGGAGATARVDGRLGWGAPAAQLAAETAIGLARAQGVGAVTILNCNHIGRVGAYVEQIAQAGMLGIALCNASPAVSPFGGHGRLMGTNPFAMAAPGGPGAPPLVLDFATSSVAEGKLRVARAQGTLIAPGLLRDAEGRATQDPAAFYTGGALESFGLHKGSGMSLMIELLARGLGGVDPTLPGNHGFNGTLMLALDIAAFAPAEAFAAAAERLAAQVAATPPLDGVARVLQPGEPERLTRARRLAEGIPLADQTWDDLVDLAAELGVEISAYLERA
jgi:uncharacterized oxidoreductase